MMYDVSFCNLHEDTVGEAYLSSKQGTRSSTRLSVLVYSFSKRKGQRRAVTSTRFTSRHGLARRAQRRGFPGEDGKAKETAGSTTIKMGELRHIARDQGCPKAEIDVLDRWSFVRYI